MAEGFFLESQGELVGAARAYAEQDLVPIDQIQQSLLESDPSGTALLTYLESKEASLDPKLLRGQLILCTTIVARYAQGLVISEETGDEEAWAELTEGLNAFLARRRDLFHQKTVFQLLERQGLDAAASHFATCVHNYDRMMYYSMEAGDYEAALRVVEGAPAEIAADIFARDALALPLWDGAHEVIGRLPAGSPPSVGWSMWLPNRWCAKPLGDSKSRACKNHRHADYLR